MRLTKAQDAALQVLAAAGGPVEVWKFASVTPGDDWARGVAHAHRVNFTAADRLRSLGLAVYVIARHRSEYKITPEGLAEWNRRRGVEAQSEGVR